MKKIITMLLVLGLFSGFMLAKETPKPTCKARPAVRSSHRGHSSIFRGMNLTGEQKVKIAAIKKNASEKIKKIIEESKAEVRKVLTKDQIKKIEDMKKKFAARKEAFKKKFEAHKKGKHGDKKGSHRKHRRGPGCPK